MRHSERNKLKLTALVVLLCLASVLLAGCKVKVTINKPTHDLQETLENRALTADPVEFSPDGAYAVVFHYEKGGLTEMDMSRAYVAYYPYTVIDQIETITGGNEEETPALPSDAQEMLDEAAGAGELQKIATVAILTMDDNTLKISFADPENVPGREYFFIIQDEGISGSFIPQ